MLEAISPIDGRYQSKTEDLSRYFSEEALIRYRVRVELEYFLFLNGLDLEGYQKLSDKHITSVNNLLTEFNSENASAIKEIEATTNHDVKAVEYFIKKHFEAEEIPNIEFVHFGLTSQDINNTSFPLMIKEALTEVLIPAFKQVSGKIKSLADEYKDLPMLARTHGQPASPTLLGKEFRVFHDRLVSQLETLQAMNISGKFGGATGNMNAHFIAYPDINWHLQANTFLEEKLGIKRQGITTQIEHYDGLAQIFHSFSRLNTILIDFSRDIWTYISMNYFLQKTIKGEVGSSAMPHKVNPIDFENAEGNLGIANAIFSFLSDKLPISRLQRDLTDSTVLRNVGVPFAHTLIALKSLLKGMDKLLVNKEVISEDLEDNWAVLAEAYQTILRRINYPKPYEALKSLTRGEKITRATLHEFVQNLDVDENTKQELLEITPHSYVGRGNY